MNGTRKQESVMEEVASIKQAMSKEIGGPADGAHQDADELLCKLARTLAQLGSAEIQQDVEDIIKSWNDVERWYA